MLSLHRLAATAISMSTPSRSRRPRRRAAIADARPGGLIGLAGRPHDRTNCS